MALIICFCFSPPIVFVVTLVRMLLEPMLPVTSLMVSQLLCNVSFLWSMVIGWLTFFECLKLFCWITFLTLMLIILVENFLIGFSFLSWTQKFWTYWLIIDLFYNFAEFCKWGSFKENSLWCSDFSRLFFSCSWEFGTIISKAYKKYHLRKIDGYPWSHRVFQVGMDDEIILFKHFYQNLDWRVFKLYVLFQGMCRP